MDLNILIIDDHALIRAGIKKVLSDENGINSIIEASSAEDAEMKLKNHIVDIILLDISMPGKSGLEFLPQLKREYPGIPIIILSMHPEDRFAVRSLKSGASGYLTKESAPEELMKAITSVIETGSYVSRNLAQRIAASLQKGELKHFHEKLSEREFEIFRMIASGKTVSRIAEELHLGITTVSTYRARIMDKMNMKTNAELTYYAISNGLVD